MSDVGKLDFSKFKTTVAAQFARMAKHELYCVEVDKDALWNTYLDSFPAGTNEMYRQRREYDCACCRSFIKRVGCVVAIIDGRFETIWDGVSDVPAFNVVSHALKEMVRQHPIANKFLTPEKTAGVDKNFEELLDKEVRTWQHFFINIPKPNQAKGTDIGPKLSQSRADHDVLLRSLTELTHDSVEIVQDLIAQGSLYRGEDYRSVIGDFVKLKRQFAELHPNADKDLFVWDMLRTTGGAVARIRNTAIGTLLIDLSAGLEMEDAVRKYESVVAPTNYKRPTALVTQKMVASAKAKVDELGLTSALQRRYATIDDVPVANLLFVDRTSTAAVADDAFAGVATKAGAGQKFDKVETIGIDDFIANVLPTAKHLDVMFDGTQTGNLCSLVTAADPSATHLFQWQNPFSWSYNGDLADSIKERVKQAGGNVTGDICCRLAWYNHDDLDFHMLEKFNSTKAMYEIAFPNKGRLSPAGGMLDVDMNAGGGHTRTPVENIFYRDGRQMPPGAYTLFVHQYARRDSADPGFEVEIDILGNITRFAYPNPLPTGKRVDIAVLHKDKDGSVYVEQLLQGTAATREVWGIKTNNWHKVRALMLSPNYWQGGVGNKHFMFMLDQCQNAGQARGFYNEFIRGDLAPHRKVLEIVGSKMRADNTAQQLSGLGFSSTKRAEVLVRVSSTFTRVVRVSI